MQCPQCQFTNPPGTIHCVKCATPLGIAAADVTVGDVSESWAAPARTKAAQGVTGALPTLEPGMVLGGRYEIVELLGEGGMGAVYKARDRELDRLVALKVIHPELARNPQILQRFKQELILARQITHKNVIRIFDLGAADGIKFITMEFVEGQDLKSLLRQGHKFTPEEAAGIIQQVCRALHAAHTANVVHRDLKPQNIMVDKQEKILVMDFGIARSMEMSGLTQTGTLMGTPEYMSPEQAKGEEIDARSDLFTLGIIFYELLLGKVPFEAETPFKTMLKRTQERATPPIQLDPSIPQFMNDVVMRCLEIDPKPRYQSALEILKDLEARQGTRASAAVALPPPRLRLVEPDRKWIAVGFTVLVLLIAGIVFRQKIFLRPGTKQTAAVPQVSLAILPFRNASGDAALDWLGPSLAEMLATDVGQSAYLRMVSSDRLHQILHDLRITPDSNLDRDTLRRLAEFSNAQTVVWGQYAKFGDQIRIDATLQDLKRDHTATLKAEAANEKALLGAVDQLAQAIQKNLALSTRVVRELQAQAFKPSSRSVQALRYYNEGLQLLRQGNNLEAQKRFESSTKEDPQFALAYAKLGQTYANLGRDSEAEQFSRKAVDLSENLAPQEKYRIVGSYARIMKDYPKAIEAFENLAKVSPGDTDVQFALAGLYEDTGSLDRARDFYSKVLASDSKHVDALLAMGRVEGKSGNPQSSLDYLNRALTLAIQLENEEEKALILLATGIAYRIMNKPGEALRNYQESLDINRRIGQKRGIAANLSEMSQVQAVLGKPQAALATLNEALKVQREIGAKKEAGDTLIALGNLYEDRGQHDQALEMYKESLQIQRDAGDETYQALCLNNIGSIHFSKGEYEDALTYFQQALQLREKLKVAADMAETVYNLAGTNAQMGQYDQALTQYLRALDLYRSAGDKRGAALDSYSLGTVFGYQGRYGAAVNAAEEALKTFRALQERSVTTAEILSGYGDALAAAGRGEEAQKSLEEAMSVARDLKNAALIAQVLNSQGDSSFYRGDFRAARASYERALQSASHAKDRDQTFLSRFNLAKATLKEGRSREAINPLKGLAQEADAVGLKYLSVECSTYLAEALVNTKDYSRARQELEQELGKAEKLGLRALLAKNHYLLATALRLTGKGTEAAGHYREALRLLEEISREAGSSKVIERADLKSIYAESTRWSQGPES